MISTTPTSPKYDESYKYLLLMAPIDCRLDAITSGALIFAKNLHTARALGEEFSAGRVTKYYVALSARKPSKKQGSVVGEMIKTRRGSWMLQRAIKNRPAVTRFTSTAVKDASFEIGMPPLRAFLLKPSTGRTHQIRVAMKSLGAPIFGDARYSNIQNDENAIKSLLGTQATLETPMELSQQSGLVDRGYLHATALRFCLGEEQIQIVCKPEDEDEGFCFAKIEGVKSVINHWFPSGIENEYGAWFPDDKLLQSSFKMTE